MVLIIFCHIFFNRKMAYSLSMSAFIAKALNSIIKSTIFFFPCLKDSILHSASATFVLSLNVIFSSLMNSSQSCVSNSSSSSLSFFYVYIPATPSLRYARITVILSLVSMTLLLLRNNHIPLYQFSNFVWFLSNHPRSKTILFGIIACVLSFIVTGTGATDISLSDHSYVCSKASFIICKDPSFSNSVSILSVCLKLVLVLLIVYATCFFVLHLAVTLPNSSMD